MLTAKPVAAEGTMWKLFDGETLRGFVLRLDLAAPLGYEWALVDARARTTDVGFAASLEQAVEAADRTQRDTGRVRALDDRGSPG